MSGTIPLLPLYALMVWTRQLQLFPPLKSIIIVFEVVWLFVHAFVVNMFATCTVPFIQSSFVDQTNNTNNTSYAAAYYLISPFVHLLGRLFYVSIFFSEFRSQIPSNYLKCLKISIPRIFRIFIISVIHYQNGDRGDTMVKVLCYKSEGRWLDPSWCQWIFHWHKILPIALWPWGRLIL